MRIKSKFLSLHQICENNEMHTQKQPEHHASLLQTTTGLLTYIKHDPRRCLQFTLLFLETCNGCLNVFHGLLNFIDN